MIKSKSKLKNEIMQIFCLNESWNADTTYASQRRFKKELF